MSYYHRNRRTSPRAGVIAFPWLRSVVTDPEVRTLILAALATLIGCFLWMPIGSPEPRFEWPSARNERVLYRPEPELRVVATPNGGSTTADELRRAWPIVGQPTGSW